MRRIILATVILLSSVCRIFAGEIRKDDIASVPPILYLTIQNLGNFSSTWKNGENCRADENGNMTVIGLDGSRILILYKTGPNSNPYSCPNGTVAFISRAQWDEGLQVLEKKRAKETAQERDRPIVEKLLQEYLKK